MKKFIVLYHAPANWAEAQPEASEDDMKESMQKWMAWAEECGSSLVDMGSPLGGGLKLSKSGTSPSDKGVIGYSILQAEDMEGAKSLIIGHPHLEWAEGCNIEVHESFQPQE